MLVLRTLYLSFFGSGSQTFRRFGNDAMGWEFRFCFQEARRNMMGL